MLTARAPGRVNLIGEHTDTSGGLVLPIAIDRYVTLQAMPTRDGVTRLVSETFSGVVEVSPSGELEWGSAPWGRYVAAVIRELRLLGVTPAGLEGRIRSDVPAGAGLSSSAALEVAVATALVAACGVQLDGRELALACQRAEHDAVGVPCGPMDQLISVLGVEGHGLRIDCSTLAVETIPIPGGVGVLVLESGVERRLEESPYALRLAELRAGHEGRLRHVRTENARVDELCAVLRQPIPDRATIGELFRASHLSLARDFEVSTPEVDTLVALAVEEGAFAARLTGAGFGGCVVALGSSEGLDALGQRTMGRYRAATGLAGRAHVCRAAGGARCSVSPAAVG